MPLVTPGSPAERAGIKPGDVIIGEYSKLVQSTVSVDDLRRTAGRWSC